MKFKTKITTKELFQFLMKHSYAGFSGKAGLIISFAAAILFIKNVTDFAGNETKVIILGIIALLFTVINPVLLWMKAKQQQLTNPAYKNEMEYTLTEEGIDLQVADQTGGIPWDMIMKIVETNSLYILYTTRINAFLWPKKDMGSQENAIIHFLLDHIDRSSVKLPKKMRDGQ